MRSSIYTPLHLLCIIILLGISSCKKEEPNDGGGDGGTDLREEASLALQENMDIIYTGIQEYADILQQSGDSLMAMDHLLDFFALHPLVDGGWIHNDEYFEVHFSNGLKAPVMIIPTDEQGLHLNRGGGAGNKLGSWIFDAKALEQIKNEKVFIASPQRVEFGYYESDFEELRTIVESGGPEFELSTALDSDFNLAVLDHIDQYGLIILDTHGAKNGFFMTVIKQKFELTDIWTPEEVIAEAFDVQSIPPNALMTGQIQIGVHVETYDGNVEFYFTALITEDYVRQLDIDLSDAVVFGNHCYSGHGSDGPTENNMREAWRSRGAAAYYGYALADGSSIVVQNEFCRDMEHNLLSQLIVQQDSTGSAHLDMDDTEYFYLTNRAYRSQRAFLVGSPRPPRPTVIWPMFFYQYLEENYSYEIPCEPLTDTRDGKLYKTACIDGQRWMAENLRYEGGQVGKCYENDPEYCEAFGRLYTIQELTGGQEGSTTNPVQGLCPEGWHVPTWSEYHSLLLYLFDETGEDFSYAVGAEFLADSAAWGISPAYHSGLDLAPNGVGYLNDGEQDWGDLFSENAFEHNTMVWTSSSHNEPGYPLDFKSYMIRDEGAGITIVIGHTQGGVNGEEISQLPCRCVQD